MFFIYALCVYFGGSFLIGALMFIIDVIRYKGEHDFGAKKKELIDTILGELHSDELADAEPDSDAAPEFLFRPPGEELIE